MNIRKFASLALVLLSLLSVSCGGFEARINEIFKFAGEQLKKTAVEVADPSKFPVNTTETGEWQTTGSRGWTSGFFPGCLWLAFEHTGDEEIKQLANKWTLSLDQIKYYTGNHDIGFMIFSSYGQGYRLTGNANFSDVIHTAAKSLMTRYNKDVQSIQSWNANNRWKFPVIVDNMMNLELLFWSARNGGSSELYDIAVQHALTTMKNHVRPDGSTFHVVDYDPANGEVRGKYTAQGFSDDSCWSRGQAWGLYGFTMTYRETQREEFLTTAMNIADYFIAHLPDDSVPYWDFSQTNKDGEERDTSAGAIAASGLLELSTLVKDDARKKFYRESAVKILTSLSTSNYLNRAMKSNGILLHGVASKPHGNAVDRSLIYGDYYYLEALLRLKRGIANVN